MEQTRSKSLPERVFLVSLKFIFWFLALLLTHIVIIAISPCERYSFLNDTSADTASTCTALSTTPFTTEEDCRSYCDGVTDVDLCTFDDSLCRPYSRTDPSTPCGIIAQSGSSALFCRDALTTEAFKTTGCQPFEDGEGNFDQYCIRSNSTSDITSEAECLSFCNSVPNVALAGFLDGDSLGGPNDCQCYTQSEDLLWGELCDYEPSSSSRRVSRCRSRTKFLDATTPPPSVTGLNPSEGPETGGTAVTISGSNLNGATMVEFGAGNDATVVSVSDNEIQVISPPGTGLVSVRVTTPDKKRATSDITAASIFQYALFDAVPAE